MPAHLLFAAYGPMASWGGEAPGTYRPTSDHPSKSAVLGIVAGALGYDYGDDERHAALTRGLAMAVRVDAAGLLLRDYHTVQTIPRERKVHHPTRRSELTRDPQSLQTILTSRDYRIDGCWTIALWELAGSTVSLPEIRDALLAPRFVPYLGRKSCPLGLPLHAQIVEAETLREALGAYSPPHRRFLQGVDWSPDPVVYMDVEHPASGLEADDEQRVRDDVLSRARRQFQHRVERVVKRGVPLLMPPGGATGVP